MSKAVQAVEDRLGVRIFERANNGVRLTVEGEIVYRRALNILQEFEALEADVAALHKLEKGVLRIGFPPVASGILFADLLSKYRQLYPGINISLQEQGCASLEPMVLSGDLDLAVTLLPVPPNFSWLQIRDEPLMVIMPPDHPLADRKRLKMDELADNAFIGFEQGFLLNDRIEAVCRQRGLKLNECLRSGQLDFIMTPVSYTHLDVYKRQGRNIIGSFNHGSMACALPMSIGAQLLYPERQVIALCGDGGMTMLMGELLTLVQYNLPVKVIVYNNGALGFINLEMRTAGYPEFQTDMKNPDFARMAEVIGMKGFRIEKGSDVEPVIKAALATPGPVLVDVLTDPAAIPLPPTITAGEAKGLSLIHI